MTPTVSIVVPAHNGMPWIKDAIDSVGAQSFADWEIVVRDDGSTDGTREWLTSLTDKRIRVEFADAAGAHDVQAADERCLRFKAGDR